MEVGAHVSLNVATKGSLRGKKLWKFTFLDCFSKAKTEECDQRTLFFSDKLAMLMPCSNTYFLEVSAHVSLKVATKDYFRCKNSKDLALLFLSSKLKTWECDQKGWSVFDQFAIIISSSATNFLETDARVSLKVATKGPLRGKKLWKYIFLGCFSKVKTEECDTKRLKFFYQFGITISCLVTYFLEVGARVSLKVATKGSLKITLKISKKLWKYIFLGCFSKAKTEECEQKVWNVFDQFGIIPFSATYFLEVGACVSLKVANKESLWQLLYLVQLHFF